MSTIETNQLFAKIDTLLADIDRHEGHPLARVKFRELKELIASRLTTPTPLPAAPDWRALCAELLAQCDAGEMAPVEALEDIRAALATPPAPSLEPRGCPTPGACSCPTAPIVPMELIRALELAEAALADIGDADREPGDDIAWADRRAAQDLPRIRHALRTWRDHATSPAATRNAEHDDGDDAIDRWVDSKSDWISNWGAPRSDIAALIGEALEHWGHSTTREAGPLPQSGAEISDEELEAIAKKAEVINMKNQCGLTASSIPGIYNQLHGQRIAGLRAVWDRALLARWGGAAVQPVPAAAAGEVQP